MGHVVAHGLQALLQFIDFGTDRFAQGFEAHARLFGQRIALGALLRGLLGIAARLAFALLLACQFAQRVAQFACGLEQRVQRFGELLQCVVDLLQRAARRRQPQVERVVRQRRAGRAHLLLREPKLLLGLIEAGARGLELACARRGLDVRGTQRFVGRRVLPFGGGLALILVVPIEAALQRQPLAGELRESLRDLFEPLRPGRRARRVTDVGGGRLAPMAAQRAEPEAARRRDPGFGNAVVVRAAGDALQQALHDR